MKQITTIAQILKLASQKKCVLFKTKNHPTGYKIPAAFVQNYQARMLHNQLRMGYYFHYEKKT